MPKSKKRNPSYNAQFLNINTIITNKNTNNSIHNLINNKNADITSINTLLNSITYNVDNVDNLDNVDNVDNTGSIQSTHSTHSTHSYKNGNVNNSINRYKIVKYLGEGIQGSLYLATKIALQPLQKPLQKSVKRYICKKTILNDSNEEQMKQIEFELNILKYLSSNSTTREYINPCLQHNIIDKQIFTIFPVFDGYSLHYLTNYLQKLDNSSYYNIVFHIIKNILHGLSKIHKTKIAHQNINDSSILVSTYTKPKEITIKFTDFGIGCGNTNLSKKIINIEDYYNDSFFNIKSCKKNNYTPVDIDDSIVDKLTDSDYLAISQKYDLLCLGMLFIKLLLFYENLQIDLHKGFSIKFNKQIKQMITNKYMLEATDSNNDKSNSKKIFTLINVNDSIKSDIIEYLRIILKYIFCDTVDRQSCQYVLDKIIIYEKYKNDVF